MTRIRVHEAEATPWERIGDLSKNSGVLTPTELDSHLRLAERGTESEPQLMELDYVPNAVIAPHHHDCDEILYVVEGEMHFGSRVLGPGASIFIGDGAVYSYKAGPAGLKVLNFRPRADYSYHPKGV